MDSCYHPPPPHHTTYTKSDPVSLLQRAIIFNYVSFNKQFTGQRSLCDCYYIGEVDFNKLTIHVIELNLGSINLFRRIMYRQSNELDEYIEHTCRPTIMP